MEIQVLNQISQSIQAIENFSKQGSLNRLLNMKKYLETNNIRYNYLFSFENGIMKNKNIMCSNYSNCCDFCCFSYQEFNCEKINFGFSNKLDENSSDNSSDNCNVVFIPEKYFNKCIELSQEKTIGEVIQDETGIPKDSFHQFYNKLGLTRIDIMSNIIIK